jgi:hypothetical protein
MKMKISIPFRLFLLVKLILTLSLVGILNPFPHLLAAEPLLEIRGTDPNSLTFTAAREIARDANGHWHIIYKKRQGPENGIWMARTTDGKPVGVQRTRVLLPLGRTPLSQNETQWDIAAGNAIKILIKEEGWYWVRQPELVSAGLNPRVNPKKLQLFVDGQEQAIRVVGQDDKRFDSQDFIEFYATGLDTPFTDTRTYYLLEGEVLGQRITTSQGRGLGPVPDSFPFSVTFKERVYYFTAIKNGDAENFFGPAIAPASILAPGFLDVFIGASNLDSSSHLNATLEIALQGVTVVPHSIKILLNDVKVRDVELFEQSREVFEIEVPQSHFREGENKITLIPEGGEPDVSVVDYIQLTYWHSFAVDDNVLKFEAEGSKRVTIEGFSRPRIRVVDYTDPLRVLEVIGDIEPRGTGYIITFKVPSTGTRTLMAFTENKIKKPLAIVANKLSSWHQQTPGYDFVIISHKDFLKALKLLQQRRESQGLSVALVDVEDIYDEFNFGSKSPQAIKDFLVRATTNWDKRPRFVLLVGDATFDPRNYFGVGDYDFVPTKILETASLETASDDWFADVDDDGLPDMAVGRLPVRTPDGAAKLVTKILGYEKGLRMDHAVMVADKVGYFNFDYAQASREVEALLPSSIVFEEILRDKFDSNAEAKEALVASINEGPLLVNYIGDGSTNMWEGQILNSGDAPSLTNRSRLPLFLNMTSLNGFFHDIYVESLAEALLKPAGGGAIAVWASSGLTEPEEQVVMNKEFVRLLFNGEGLTIGEAAMRAKVVANDPDVRKTWILFGDPTTKLRY